MDENRSVSLPGQRVYRFYDLIMASFVCVLLCANLIGTSKVTTVTLFGHEIRFGAGNLFFPLSYLFGDILTEVYGYARSRKVVWAGFGALAFASAMSTIIVHLPPARGWEGQAVVEAAFGSTWRIALASLCGYFVGGIRQLRHAGEAQDTHRRPVAVGHAQSARRCRRALRHAGVLLAGLLRELVKRSAGVGDDRQLHHQSWLGSRGHAHHVPWWGRSNGSSKKTTTTATPTSRRFP